MTQRHQPAAASANSCSLVHRPSNPTPRRARKSVDATANDLVDDTDNSTTNQQRPVVCPLLRRSPFRQLLLLLALFGYQVLGALLFLLCEQESQRQREARWERELGEQRAQLMATLAAQLADVGGGNGSRNVSAVAMDQRMEELLQRLLPSALVAHERSLVNWCGDHPRMRWDFWNAMLFALSIFTTIGYGHLYARTRAGRVLTMLYALGGIPLLMLVLDELGALLSRLLRSGWFLCKCACRRLFRSCTRQSRAEIRALDAQDCQEIRCSSQLPLSLAAAALFGWICLCAGLTCLWEWHWDFPTAFYFFFTSLTTIGLGDVTPGEPRYLMLLSVGLIIGLALVSMTIGLVQAKTTRPCLDHHQQSSSTDSNNNNNQGFPVSARNPPLLRRHACGSSLGVFSTNTSSSRGSAIREKLRQRPWHNKCTQTLLSFPSPAIRDARVCRAVTEQGLKQLPHSLSIDDVMRLVDTEEGDILLLSELTLSREVSGLSGETITSNSSSLLDANVNSGSRLGAGSTSSNSSESARIWNRPATNHDQQQQRKWAIGGLGGWRRATTETSAASGRPQQVQFEVHTASNRKQTSIPAMFHSFSSFDRYCPPSIGPAANALPSVLLPSDIPLIFPLFSSLLGGHQPPPATNSLRDLELLEELEDRMLLSHGGTNNGGGDASASVTGQWSSIGSTTGRTYQQQQWQPPPHFGMDKLAAGTASAGVHFRSRLSLIPEQRSLDEELEPVVGGGEKASTSQAKNHHQSMIERGTSAAEDLEIGSFGKQRGTNSSTSWSSGLSALLKGAWKKKGGRPERRSASLTSETMSQCKRNDSVD